MTIGSIIGGIESYYKDELSYQKSRHLSLGLSENLFEYELILTPDCPYYKDGIRCLKRKKRSYFMDHSDFNYINNVYYFDVDLSFIQSSYFEGNTYAFPDYLFFFTSNEFNLSNLVIDLSNFRGSPPYMYFFIDMSSNHLILLEDFMIKMDFYQYLSWLDSGLNVSLHGYWMKCSNFYSGYIVDDSIFINDLLTNFNRLFLTNNSKSMCLSSGSEFKNVIVIDIQFSFSDSMEKFMEFISSLKSILLSNYCNDKLLVDFHFEVIFLKYENPSDYLSLYSLKDMFSDYFNGDLRISLLNMDEGDKTFYHLL